MINVRPRTWFPLILAILTMTLLTAVFILFGPAFFYQETLSEPSPVLTETYQTQFRAIVYQLDNLDQASDDQQRQIIVQNAQNDLLALIVPANYRELHLEMVIALNLIIRGYQSGDLSLIDEGRRRWQTRVDQYPWLR